MDAAAALGADAVGMSTAPEVVAAAQLGVRVLGISTVTNLCLPDAIDPTCSDQVVATAVSSQRKVWRIVRGILADIDPLE